MAKEPHGKRQGRPNVGDRVLDTASGRVGILRGIDEEWVDPSVPRWDRPAPRPVAFIRPEGGGREWMTAPHAVTFAE